MNNTSYLLFIIILVSIGCSAGQQDAIQNEGYISTNDGLKLYYQTMGEGQDSIIVIHGGPGAGIPSILPSVQPLAKDHFLILYDQRGGGRSGLPADTSKLHVKYYVQDLEAVRSHFGIKKMNVITHSFGAILFAEYATQYPNRINRVLLHGATGPRRVTMAQMFKKKATQQQPSPDTALSRKASQLLDTLLKGTSYNPISTCKNYETATRLLTKMQGKTVTYKGTTCQGPAEAVRYYYHKTARIVPNNFGNWDYTDKLQQVTAPALIVYGKQDSMAHPMQYEWLQAFPNSRLLLVPNTGKAAFSGNPEVTYPATTTFFNGSWPPKSRSK